MEYRYLGRTGVRVSPICLGCMMFGRKTEANDAYAMIDRAIDAGVNFIDTANVYSRGKSEEVTGEALKRNGKRERIVLATKVHGRMHDEESDPNAWGNSRRMIIEQCDASLKRLQTDYIDLYQIHRPHPDCAIDETLQAMDDLVRAGKVRYIGTSTFAAWQVVEALWTSRELKLNRFVTEQPPYNLLDRRIEHEILPMAQTFGLAIIPWSPLAGGFLTGKYRRSGEQPSEARMAGASKGRDKEILESEHTFAIVDKLTELASEKSCTPAQLALAWCMHQPGVTSPIIGPRTMEQLEDNLGAVEVTVSDSDRQALDEVAPPGTHAADYFDARFGPHPHRV